MRLDVQWAPLLYTNCSPLTRTPSFSSADDPMTRCGLRGEMATPMRQGVWCLLPVVLNAVPIHTRVVLPPAKAPSLLLTAPPRSPTNPYPNHPATSPPSPQTPPPSCGMPAAVCLKEALCARRKTNSCTAEPSSNRISTTPPTYSRYSPYSPYSCYTVC